MKKERHFSSLSSVCLPNKIFFCESEENVFQKHWQGKS